MKKLTLLAILVTTITIAQKQDKKLFKVQEKTQQLKGNKCFTTFYLGFDARNCTIGSAPTNNKAELDFIFGVGAIKNNWEFNLGGEIFKAIEFQKFTFSVGRQIRITDKITFIGALEYTNIQRRGTWGGGLGYEDNLNFHSLAVNLSFRYKLSENFGLEYMLNILPRTDLLYKYENLKTVPSNYIKVVYLIKISNKHRETRQEWEERTGNK